MPTLSIRRLSRALVLSLIVFVILVASVLWQVRQTASQPAQLSGRFAKRQVHDDPVLERGVITWRRLDTISDTISGNVRTSHERRSTRSSRESRCTVRWES